MKHYTADVLTALRFVCAGVLIFFAIEHVNPSWAILVFIFGELTDAFDGIAARAWPYPNDGKKHWFHDHAVVLDQVADLLLGFAILLYVGLNVSAPLSIALLFMGIIIAIPIQILRARELALYGKLRDLMLRVVLVRRFFYVGAIFLLWLVLLWYPATFDFSAVISASGVFWLKIGLTVISLMVGLVLIAVKTDRLSEDKTPTPTHGEQLRRKKPKSGKTVRLGEYHPQHTKNCKK